MSAATTLKAVFAFALLSVGGTGVYDVMTGEDQRIKVESHTNVPGDGERNGPRVLANGTNAEGKRVSIDVTGADDKLQDGKTYDVHTNGIVVKSLTRSRIVAAK